MTIIIFLVLMPYPQDLRSVSCRKYVRIEGRLHSTGSRVYIPEILEHGIIQNVLARIVVLHVLDKGRSLRHIPHQLRVAIPKDAILVVIDDNGCVSIDG